MRLVSPASDDQYIRPAADAMPTGQWGVSYGGFGWELALSRFFGPTAFQSCVQQLARVANNKLNSTAVKGDFTHNGILFNGKSIMLGSTGDSLFAGKKAYDDVVYALGCLQQLTWPTPAMGVRDQEFEFIGFGVGGQDPFVQCPKQVVKDQPYWLRRKQLHDCKQFLATYL